MNKEMIIAKIQRWQAELSEIVATLNGEQKSGPILDILKERAGDINHLIEAIQDKSFITPGDVKFEPQPVLDEIEEKVKKVKAGVKKIKKLSKEKKRIIRDLEEYI
ncbi:MAG: hypothetical protein KKH94_04835 [Candidatus Omnitrophica bacterium]|nr:hypothetical protein [Candidatus Omnitrophota bacterium]